jgi:hypothetical protein
MQGVTSLLGAKSSVMAVKVGRFAHSWRKVAVGDVGAGRKKNMGRKTGADRKRVLMNASVDQTLFNRNR